MIWFLIAILVVLVLIYPLSTVFLLIFMIVMGVLIYPPLVYRDGLEEHPFWGLVYSIPAFFAFPFILMHIADTSHFKIFMVIAILQIIINIGIIFYGFSERLWISILSALPVDATAVLVRVLLILSFLYFSYEMILAIPESYQPLSFFAQEYITSSRETITSASKNIISKITKEDESIIENESEITEAKDDIAENIDTSGGLTDSPRYHWNFQTSIDEKNGLSTQIFGDTHIISVDAENIGNALYLDGDGDYIDCGKEINLNDNFTFTTLLRCDDVDKSYSSFFSKYETNYRGAYAFAINKGHINIWITTDENKNHAEMESTAQLINGEWYYITIVKENSEVMLYLNGQIENQMHIEGYLINDDTVTIGRQALMFSPEEQLQFTGAIADIAVYDFAWMLPK